MSLPMLISARKHQVMSRKGIVFSFGTKVALTMQLVFYLLAASCSSSSFLSYCAMCLVK
jgi:hypothetical protein